MKLPLITSLIHYYKVFYGYVGNKLFVLMFLILLGVLLEGIGISMLLPVLNIDRPESSQDQYTKIVYQFLESIGIGVSIFSLIILLFIAFSLKGILLFLQKTLSTYIRLNLIRTMRIEFCNKYKDMEYCYYANTSIGYLNNIITTEIERGIASLNRYLQLINGITMIIVYVSFASIVNYRMTILVLVLSIFMFVMLRRLSWISRKLSLLVSETNAHIQSLLIQTIYNFKYLKATDSFTHIHKHLFKNIDNNFMYKFRGGVLSAFSSSIVEPLAVLLMSGLILYSVGYQGKSIAGIFVLLLFFYKAFVNVFSFQSQWQGFNATLGGLETIRKADIILDKNVEVSGVKHIECLNKAIELRNVNYSYDSRQVLFNINLSIPKNKSIGIVGESGAGKTTLFDVFSGLLVPQTGRVCIDEIDYKELDLACLRNLIGYITQEPVIFNDTIANNISLWECDMRGLTCIERMKNSAILANCADFISDTEKGYETIIGDKGVKLSGGQRQRIAIARELFKQPEIIIFDEATSSLDTESEMLIQQSINSMKGTQTIVIISHRLSTIRDCDHIYVLKKGRIIEEGSFNKLCRDEKSSFYNMCQAQNL